jgi:ankyrin repeat protein
MLISLLMFSLGIGVGYLVFHKLTPAPMSREAFEATEKLMTVWFETMGQGRLASDVSREAYVRGLISEGADVNVKDKDNVGFTPLYLAATNAHTPIVMLLIEAGANVNAKNDWGQTPLDAAVQNTDTVIVTLLIEKGADVNTKSTDPADWTPLMRATAKKSPSPEIITRLIEAGAEVNAKDTDDRTPLSLTTNPEIIKILKAAGAQE